MKTWIGGGPKTATVRPRVARHRAVALLVALMLAAGVSTPASGQEADPAADPERDLSSAYDEILGEEARLVEAIDGANEARRDLLTRLQGLNQELAATEAELATAQSRLSEAEAAESAAEAALDAAKRRVEEATTALRERAVANYMHGGRLGNAFQAVENLAAGDSAQAVKTLEYAGVVVDHQQDLVGEFVAARRSLSRRSEEAASARAEAQGARDTIAAARDSIQQDRAGVADLERRAADEETRERQALAELTSRKLEIESRIVDRQKTSDGIAAILATQQAGQPDYVQDAIDFVHPLPGYDVGGEFGMRQHPILGYSRLHAGADIGGRTGEPIRAAADGAVLVAGPRGGYGNAVVIDHGHGIGTVSAHQTRVAVRAGQLVRAGDVIGYVGTSGLSTGPHLHFETRLRGTPVNPRNFVDLTPGG